MDTPVTEPPTEPGADPAPKGKSWAERREALRGGARKAGAWASRSCRGLGLVLDRLFRPGTRDWACAAHLLPITVYAVPYIGFRAASIFVAFLVWRLRGSEPAVEDQGLEALNFQINLLVWTLLAELLCTLPIFPISVAGSLLAVVAGIRTAQGAEWRYPLLLRVVK